MRALLVGFLIAASAFGAHRGGFGGGFRGSHGGGFRGGARIGHAPVGQRGFSGHFRGHVGAVGFRGFSGHNRGNFGGIGFRFGGFSGGFGGWSSRSFGFGGFGWPAYSYPPLWSPAMVYGSPYSYTPYGYAAPPTNVTVVAPPAASYERPSTIVINESPRRWQISEYEKPAQPTSEARPAAPSSPIYLIAMKDGLIWAALAYWLEDGQLGILTTRQERKQLPLGEIDRPLSEQLNRERRIELRLP